MFRRHQGSAIQDSMDEVITPFLDMAFQLLAFFIFTYHPSQLEGQMELSLPSKSDAAAKTPQNVAPESQSHNVDIDIPADITTQETAQKNTRMSSSHTSISYADNCG